MRGPKPRFSQEEIVDTALALLEARGREAVSLRAIAEELGVTPMALYRYFADKDELLDAVLAKALAPSTVPGTEGEQWDVQLEQAIRDMHAALSRSPAVAELMALRAPGAQLDPLRERLRAITSAAGMDDETAADVLRTLTSYALGFALVARSDPFDNGLRLIMDSVRRSA